MKPKRVPMWRSWKKNFLICCWHFMEVFFSLERDSFISNRPLSNFRVPKISHFQNETWCKTFLVKMSFICMRIRNHSRINTLALSLDLKQRLATTRKWRFQSVSRLFAPPSQHPSRGDKARKTLLPGRQLVRGWGGGERRDGWYFLHLKDITLS